MKRGVTARNVAVLLGVATTFSYSAQAQESSDHTRPKHYRQHVTEMTVTGKVSKNGGKDKEGGSHGTISMVTAGGDRIIFSTGNRAEDGQPTRSQLDKFVGKIIQVSGKGYAAEEGDRTVVYIISVTRIQVIEPDAGK